MQGDAISRSAVLDAMPKDTELLRHQVVDVICNSPSIDVVPVITGETSDGYHTFNELYHHRAVLFSVIVKAFPDRAWKSRKHHDGSMYDGMFIVGIETPDGQASYHYDINPYWDMFQCKELKYAPEWDGHTSAQAIDRIGKLEPLRHGRWQGEADGYEDGYVDMRKKSGWISVKDRLPQRWKRVLVAAGDFAVDVYEAYIDSKGEWMRFNSPIRANIGYPTYWIPLPEPPKEGSNEQHPDGL